MGALTPSFLFDFESRMRIISENEYVRFAANLWWSKFAKVIPSGSKREMITWLLSTAQIQDQGKGGNIAFDDIVSKYTEFENKDSGAGLKMRRQQLEDLDGGGINIATQWSADIGAYMAYWPQKQLVNLLKNGHTASLVTGYDALAFFSASHLTNPANSAVGTFANLFTGGASGTYPGACPIDESVPLDQALINLGKVIGYVKSIKMPNGEDPRFLRPTTLVVPPKLQARAVQLTSAKFLAQAATSGGGSADVEAVISSFGFQPPVIADELAGFESDTTWFLGCEQMSTSQLGAFVYVDREPFKVTYYTGQGGGTGADAALDRMQELEWHVHGRNVMGPGHPFLFHKIKAA